jgi:hypothetical protein
MVKVAIISSIAQTKQDHRGERWFMTLSRINATDITVVSLTKAEHMFWIVHRCRWHKAACVCKLFLTLVLQMHDLCPFYLNGRSDVVIYQHVDGSHCKMFKMKREHQYCRCTWPFSFDTVDQMCLSGTPIWMGELQNVQKWRGNINQCSRKSLA